MRTPRDVVAVLADHRAHPRIEQWVVAEEGATAQHKAVVALLSANQVWFARNNGHWSRIAKHARH
jgi:hypothetical protein